MSFSVSEPFKATKIWNELVDHLKTNLEPRKRRWKLQTFDNCFRGSDIVEHLQNYVFNHPELASDPSKVQVKSLAQKLLESQVIESVLSTEGKKSHKELFEQSSRLYRFSDGSSTEDLSITSSKTDRKKKRLSFDRLNIHRRSMKGRSMGIPSTDKSNENQSCDTPEKENQIDINNNEFSRKRRASFSGPSGPQGSEYFSETPRKYKRRSFMLVRSSHRSKLASKIDDDISPSFCKEIWFEIALSSLLKLLDVPFIEDVLNPPESTEDRVEFTEITNSPYGRLVESCQVQREVSTDHEHGRRGRDTVWKKAAVSCFDALREYPLSHNKDFEFHNKIALTEAGISNSLAKFYSSLMDSLIPEKFTVLVEDVLQLLSSRKRNVAHALRLLFLLLSQDRQEHLKRLLNFFDKSLMSQTRISKEQRRKYLCRVFVEGILPNTVNEEEKEKAENLLSVMIDEHEKLFQMPSNIKSEAKRHLLCFQSGYNLPVLAMSSCKRISVAQYQKQKEDITKQSLLELMNCIMDDLNLSIKMKECRLKDFQSHHLDVFCLQFPNGEF